MRDGHLVRGKTNWNIDEQVFMAVQKAFDTLTDMTKRRAYDSSLEFDDSIPGKWPSSGVISCFSVSSCVFFAAVGKSSPAVSATI